MSKVAKLQPVVEPAQSEGHNLIGVDKSAFNAWVAKIAAAEAECKIANERRTKLRKQMRSEGVKLWWFDAMRKLVELDRTEQAEQLTHSRYYLEWLRSPLGHQITMDFAATGDAFDEDEEGAAVRTIEDAKGAGWRAGLEGNVFEDGNPYDANSEPGQAWIGAYREGQEKNVMALGDDDADPSS